jgi:tRNA pseudouridine38-40 synthase
MRVKLKLQYDGGNYCGWQVQSGQDSLQGRLEAALERLYGFKIRLYAAGRTDAGVHALGQVAVFTAPVRFAVEELVRALNALTPPDIVVVEASAASDDFDPRRDACSRIYEYRILNRPLPSPFHERYCWHVAQPLDFAAMSAAARCFLGEHDFAAFRSLGSIARSTLRRIHDSRWQADGDFLTYRVEGSSFLRHMVRTMVAVMVEIGRGRLPQEAVVRLLDSADRAQAPAPAPARGLFLVEVRYCKQLESARA